MGGIVRTLVAWCPDWPVVAAGFSGCEPVAVVASGRVVACSAAARHGGVALRMRRRTAEARCSDLCVLQRDEEREARAFDPVVAAVARLAPDVEITRPGLLALATRGPARYYGGERALCAAVTTTARDAVSDACGVAAPAVRVGVADGPFAAALAARQETVVPSARTAGFLAGFSLDVLGRPELADLLVRLGIGTLGAFAALDADKVAARFGPDGTRAHRLARGLDDRVLRSRPPAPELLAASDIDPPADRVDVAAFAGRRLGDELTVRLKARGLACTLLTIEAETEHGERLTRHWRAEVDLGPEEMGDRLRWQLEGWLAGTAAEEAPTAGITRLVFRADEVVPDVGQQMGFFGGVSAADRRAVRGLDRVAGMLGPDAIFTGACVGGRGPRERVTLVAWGDTGPTERVAAPWPGRHPAPAPALVHRVLRPAEVTDRDDLPVEVSARGWLTAAPELISIEGGPWATVVAWAGPWLCDERWWDPRAHHRRARFQLASGDGVAYLCFVERNRWFIEATYD
ncbi:MAG TPA: DNA polymerase Y family protein [Acidimicrobiales bacterium]|nr:DNA polymerase Y family protein [Acidimicrobiales bacterium]